MKQKKHRKIPALAAGTTLVAAMTLMASCSTDYEDQIVYNDIENRSRKISKRIRWFSKSCRQNGLNTF